MLLRRVLRRLGRRPGRSCLLPRQSVALSQRSNPLVAASSAEGEREPASGRFMPPMQRRRSPDQLVQQFVIHSQRREQVADVCLPLDDGRDYPPLTSARRGQDRYPTIVASPGPDCHLQLRCRARWAPEPSPGPRRTGTSQGRQPPPHRPPCHPARPVRQNRCMTPEPPTPQPSGPVYADRVYRSLAGMAGGVLLLALALWLGIDALVNGHGNTPWLALASLLLIVPLVIAFTLRPAVYANDDRLRIRNPFRAVTLPWACVDDIRASYSTEAFAGGGKYQLWAVPVSLRRRKRANIQQMRAAAPVRRPARAATRSPRARTWTRAVLRPTRRSPTCAGSRISATTGRRPRASPRSAGPTRSWPPAWRAPYSSPYSSRWAEPHHLRAGPGHRWHGPRRKVRSEP